MNSNRECPLCGWTEQIVCLHRQHVPVHQHLVLSSKVEAQKVVRGELSIAGCTRCGFVFNRTFDESKLEYGSAYDNSQTWSRVFAAHVDDRITHLIEHEHVSNLRVIEIGCGDGTFLKTLVERGNNIGVGFDPSYAGPIQELDGRLRFERRYYGADCISEAADIIVCRHVIEHVQYPLELLRSVREALAHSPHAKVYFETPTVEWILNNNVIWDFFYEHCSYFTAESLAYAFDVSGFATQQVDDIFGGQYLWLEARVASSPAEGRYPENRVIESINRFAATEIVQRKYFENKVRTLALSGKVALWGAGAKGVTLANLIDPESTFIDCVIDLNPRKQNGYIPGTGHPIVDPTQIVVRQIGTVMLMNPNYVAEVQAILDAVAPLVKLVSES